jgi:hypothetical protein
VAAAAAVFLAAASPPFSWRRSRIASPYGSTAPFEIVGRPVVADDHLERRDRLRLNRLQRVPDHVGDVVCGDDHRERGRRPRLDASCRRSEKLARRFARPGEVWPTVGGSSVQVASAGSTRARARRSEGRLQRRRQRYVTAWRRLGCVRLRARGSWRRASVPGAPPPPR